MDHPLLLHKPVGLTPYQAIRLFKQQQPQYAASKISAAGRLDPMAEGLLILLIDNQNKRQTDFLKFDKTYQAIILFGVSTDSYDLLGLPQQSNTNASLPPNWPHQLKQYIGQINQSYPPYSAVQVNGKPLYHWTNLSLLDDIDIPKKRRKIKALQETKNNILSNKDILEYIRTLVPTIEGQFRQQPIVHAWQDLLTTPSRYPISLIQVSCSSGTYIRSLVHQIGQDLNIPTTTLAINRLCVGPYHLDQAIKLAGHPNYQLSQFEKYQLNINE